MVAFCAATLVLWLSSGLVIAQCPMCGKSAEYAGTSPGEAYRTLAMAAVVLLAPTFAIMGGIGALLWKYHRSHGPTELESRSDNADAG